jgi:hypothetical protein
MREDLQCSETAKTNISRSRPLVLGLALVRKPSLHGFSGLAETSLNLRRRGRVLVEGKGRESDGELLNSGAFELLHGVFEKK